MLLLSEEINQPAHYWLRNIDLLLNQLGLLLADEYLSISHQAGLLLAGGNLFSVINWHDLLVAGENILHI